MARFVRWLRQPLDNSPLVFFRIAYGFLLFMQAAGSIVLGFVHQTFVEPRYFFPHRGFEWLTPLAGPWMYAAFAVMAVSALLVMVGAWYRPALALFTALWTLTYLMQTESYNNHYYLMILLCLLLLPTPANAWASFDARWRPQIRSLTCPRWCLLQFVVQTAIVYEFAAFAKLYPDWLDGSAVSSILARRHHVALIGSLHDRAWLAWFLAYGGLFFDALVVPLLLWRRTRLAGLALSAFFHLFNSITFGIGVFPYTALALTAFFFPGEQVRHLFFPSKPPLASEPAAGTEPVPARARVGLALLGLYFAVQLYLPLRHLHFGRNVHWTEEGHRMAWRMMLRLKEGTIRFHVRHPPSGQQWDIDPTERLTFKQALRLPTQPDMIWQFVQALEREYAEQGYDGVEIYAESEVRLNAHAPRPLVRADVDLARAEWHWWESNDWVTDLEDGSESRTRSED